MWFELTTLKSNRLKFLYFKIKAKKSKILYFFFIKTFIKKKFD